MTVFHVDTNLFEFYGYASLSSGRPVTRREGFSFVDLEPSPWAKAVYDLDFSATGRLSPGLIDGIKAGRIPNKVRVGPSSRPQDMERLLAEEGLVPGKAMRGMILDFRHRVRIAAPAGLDLSLLSGEEEFAAAARIVAVNLFEAKSETGSAFAAVLGSLGSERAFGFLGRAEGQAVSTAFAFIGGDGVAGLYFVATEAGLRGRGYGAATVSAVLDELARRGAKDCILQATEPGKSVYGRLGFADACRLVNYSLPG